MLLASVGLANWAGLTIALLLFAYLLFTLLAPERFKKPAVPRTGTADVVRNAPPRRCAAKRGGVP